MKNQNSWEMRCTVFGGLLSVAPLVLIDGLGFVACQSSLPKYVLKDGIFIVSVGASRKN